MESNSQNTRHDNHDRVSREEDISLEERRSLQDSPTISSPLYSRADIDNYWQGGPFEQDVPDGEPAYRDDLRDGSSATVSNEGAEAMQSLSLTSETQGISQQTYTTVNPSNDQGSGSPATLPWKTSSFFGTWWLELLSIFLVVGMLAVIFGAVYPYDNKPQPDWPYGVQLNMVVSAYTLVLKTFVILIVSTGLGQLKWSWFRQASPLGHLSLYGRASRGVWGSLGLVFFVTPEDVTTLPWCLAHVIGHDH